MIGKLDILRAGAIISTIDIDESTVYNEKLPGTDLITCPIIAQSVIDLKEGDYTIHNDAPYTINILPNVDKSSDLLGLKYDITFEAQFYQLLDTYVKNIDQLSFPYYGNARKHLQLIIDNANRNSSGWVIGTVDDTEDFIIDYNRTFVRSALDLIAEKVKLEWKAKGKTINMVKTVGRDTGLVFQQGRGKGLHQIGRQSDASKAVINRVYGIGGTRNIPATYRGGIEKNLIFGERYVETPGVTAGTERVKEGPYENLDIFPQFKGSVVSTTVTKDSTGKVTSSTITDSSINFNLNSQLMEGVKAKIAFLTGPLVGIEFEIERFDNTTKTVTIINNTDANGYILPNALNVPGVGDTYTFYDIKMPDAYVVDAEQRLKVAAITFLNENSKQNLLLPAKPDEKYLRDNNIKLSAGDRATLNQTDLGINEILRFTEISYPKVNPYDVTAVVGNEIQYDQVTKLFADVLKNKQEIKGINLTKSEEARRNSRNLIELKDSIVDPDGNYYTEKIKPRSIESLFLSIGAVATNFSLSGVSFSPNYLGNPNSFTATAGQLIHYDIKIDALGYIWEMQPFSISNLVATNKYFLYAKISKTTLVGSWELSTEVKLAESLAGYYILQAGVLFPVLNGRRDNALTNGMVFIVGDQITAGRMKSIDGKMFIDLTTGQLQLGDINNGLDWNVTTPNKLTIKGSVFQSGSGIISPVPLYRGDYNPVTPYFKGDTVNYNGGSWIFINDAPATGQTPADNQYWDIQAKAGADAPPGDGVEIQYSVNGTSSWHATFTTGDLFMRQRTGQSAWSSAIRIVGESGAAGSDGKYTDYQFAKNTSLAVPPSTGFTDAPPAIATGEYLWMRFGKFGPSGQIGLWSTPVRISGPQGEPGVIGPKGIDGQTLYTWVKYANDVNGNGMSDYPDGKLYIGLAPNKPTASESTNPLDYTWALFQGEGLPGEKGEDGITTYTWLKYADSPTTGMTDTATNKKYMGLAYNKTTPTESTNYADYSWSLIRGADGTSVRILGAKNTVGELPASGNTIGDGYTIAGDLYVWTGSSWSNVGRIKGDDGVNGQTSYVHIRYSNDGGLTFTANNGKTSGSSIGVTTDFNLADPIAVGSYTWTKIAGNDGTNGVSGVFTELRYQKNGSTSVPPALASTSPDPSGWTLSQPSLSIGEYLWMTSVKKMPIQGNRNLQRNSNFAASDIFAAAYGNVSLSIVSGKLRVTYLSSGSAFGVNFNALTTALSELQQYSISGSITTSKSMAIFTYIGGNQISKTINGTDTVAYVAPVSTANKIVLIYTPTMVAGDYFDISLVKIEGDKTTPWTPAPEDPGYSAAASLIGTWSIPSRINGQDGTPGTNGTNGINAFTLVNKASMLINGSTVTKITGAAAGWNAAVKSQESYYNGAVVSFKASSIAFQFMMGLNTDPDTGNNYSTLDYAIFCTGSGALFAYESGVSTNLNTNYVTSDVLSIQYSGNSVVYMKNGVVLRTITAVANQTLYLDSSFNDAGASANSITFASAGSNGKDGTNGAAGINGTNGTSQYFHVKYSANANGSGMSDTVNTYIGTVVTNSSTPPTDYTLYKWVRLQGAQGANGTNGIAGTNGANGQTSYLHIKYSNDGGVTFTGNAGEDVGTSIGQYVDFTLADSTNVSSYKWALIKGTNGINGTNGVNGTSQYFHVRYSANPNGNPISTTPNTYIGTVVTTSPTAPTAFGDYTWVRLIGAQGANGTQGIPGVNGANGQTSYLHIKYSNDGGATFTANSGETVGDYIGQYVDFLPDDSNNVSTYVWSKIKGEKGDTGATGAQGIQGPSLSNAGNYNATRMYTGTVSRIEAVKYNGLYYFTRVDAGTFSGVLPTNTSKWNPAGAQFDSIATGLLLAELAYIENLGVRNLKTSDAGRRLEIIGDLNRMIFYGLDTSTTPATPYEALRIADDVDSGLSTGQSFGGLKATAPSGDHATVSGNGFFSNGSGMQAVPPTSGLATNGSVVGALKRRSTSANGISAGVIGSDLTTSGSGNSYAVASIGKTLLAGEIHLNTDGTLKGINGYINFTRTYIGSNYWGARLVNGVVAEYGMFNANTTPHL